MNVLILINSAPSYKYFYHKIGEVLKGQGNRVFYAIDSKRSKYIEPLAEIDNGTDTFYFNDFFEENYHKAFPHLYSCTWGDFFYSDFDRFMTHGFNLNKSSDYWVRARNCLDAFFKKIYIENDIDFVLYENISNSFAYSAWRTGEKVGVKYFGLMASRIPNRFEIQTSIIDDELKKISSMLDKSITTEESSWFEEYKSSIMTIVPDYMKQNGLDNVSLKRLIRLNKIKRVLNLIKSDLKFDSYYDYQFGGACKSLVKSIRVNLARYLNSKVSRKYYLASKDLDTLSGQDAFYIYPIHYHPESSTSVLAPEYTNEFSNIINISNNLPFGTYLYVKDHVSAKGVQSKDFYKKIKSLPNVRIIHWKENVKKLICKSKGVITINSTVGYEALLLEKPVFILGRVFYEDFPCVYKLSNFNSIREIGNLIFDLGKSELLKKFFISYFRYTFPGQLDITFALTRDDVYYQNLTEVILNEVRYSFRENNIS